MKEPTVPGVFNGERYTIAQDGKSITCLVCGMTSHHPKDVFYRYCGVCHEFLDDPKDSANHFGVGSAADGACITVLGLGRRLTRAGALNLAAWLRVLADPSGEEFDRIVKEIEKS